MWRRYVPLICIAAFCACLPAQEAPPAMPLLNQSSLAFSSELERSNYLRGGISLGTTFDDNALSTMANRTSNLGSSFLPFIELDESRSRLMWKLNYAGGFVMNQNVSALNHASHDFGVEGEYRLAPHVTFSLRDHFSKTTGFYSQVNQDVSSSLEGLLQRPNQFVITPLSQQTSNTASAQMVYQFAKDSTVGFGGNFNLLHHSNVPVGSNLVDTQSVGADVYYTHRVVAQNWVGILYQYQKLSFSPLPSTTFVHSFLVVDTMRISPRFTLALFVGPQHTADRTNAILGIDFPLNTSVIPASRSNSWSVAAGGSLSWNGKHTGLTVEGSRMVNDGGGALGSVQLISVNTGIRHQWTGSFSSELGVRYGDNLPLNASPGPYSSSKMVSTSISATRSIRNSVLLTFGYARDLQQQYQGTTNSNINHNRGWATLSYQFQRPLGR